MRLADVVCAAAAHLYRREERQPHDENAQNRGEVDERPLAADDETGGEGEREAEHLIAHDYPRDYVRVWARVSA